MSESEPESGEIFEVDRIRRLVELMKEHGLSEIDLRESSQRIRLCRETASPVVHYGAPQPAQLASATSPNAPPQSASADDDEGDHIIYINSPMVGTFYTAANPNSDPYIRVGDHVDPETTVCIIEAMKVFNEIPAEVRGKIVAVLVDNEEPVDHGKPLFKIDTRS